MPHPASFDSSTECGRELERRSRRALARARLAAFPRAIQPATSAGPSGGTPRSFDPLGARRRWSGQREIDDSDRRPRGTAPADRDDVVGGEFDPLDGDGDAGHVGLERQLDEHLDDCVDPDALRRGD